MTADYILAMIFIGVFGIIGLAFALPGTYEDSLSGVKRRKVVMSLQVVWAVIWLLPPFTRIWIAGVAA